MDGIDGIAGVETASIALGYVAVALAAGATPPLTGLALAAAGAALGFLVWNWHPARIFMGDAARWFGPALVSNEFGDAWVYIFGPLVGAVAAALVFRFVIEPASGPAQELADEVAPRGPAPPAGEAPPLRQEHDRGDRPGGSPPSNPPGGIVGS